MNDAIQKFGRNFANLGGSTKSIASDVLAQRQETYIRALDADGSGEDINLTEDQIDFHHEETRVQLVVLDKEQMSWIGRSLNTAGEVVAYEKSSYWGEQQVVRRDGNGNFSGQRARQEARSEHLELFSLESLSRPEKTFLRMEKEFLDLWNVVEMAANPRRTE